MSKRLRLENERVAAIKDEEKEEEDKLKLMKERIYAPIVWKRMVIGVCIMDIKENNFQNVLDFLAEFFIPEDVLCRNAEMKNDPVSCKSFLDQCLFCMKDTCSIMAVDEMNDNEIVGVLIMRVVLKEDYGRIFGRTILLDGVAQKKCMQMKISLNRKVDIYVDFDCESYIEIEAVSIKPSHRKKGIGFTMLRCTPDVARSLHVPVIMGIFNNCSLQRCAKKIGLEVCGVNLLYFRFLSRVLFIAFDMLEDLERMEMVKNVVGLIQAASTMDFISELSWVFRIYVISEVNYVEWRDKDKNLIFDDPGAGNYTCALMAGRVPEEKPPEPVKPTFQKKVEEEKKPKTTRKEKKEAALKKNKLNNVQ